jgi:small-conductance mechanosensitive channel
VNTFFSSTLWSDPFASWRYTLLPAGTGPAPGILVTAGFLALAAVLVRLCVRGWILGANRHWIAPPHRSLGHRVMAGLVLSVKGVALAGVVLAAFHLVLAQTGPSPQDASHKEFQELLYILDVVWGGLVLDVILTNLCSPKLDEGHRLLNLPGPTCAVILRVLRSLLVVGLAGCTSFALGGILLPHDPTIPLRTLHIAVGAFCLYAAGLVLFFRARVHNWLVDQGEENPEGKAAQKHFFAWIGHIWHLLALGALGGIYTSLLIRGPAALGALLRGLGTTCLVLIVARSLFYLIQSTTTLLVHKQHDPGTSLRDRLVLERLNTHVPWMMGIARGLVLCGAIMLILQGWGVDALGFVSREKLWPVLRALVENWLIVLVFMLIWEIFSITMNYATRPRLVNGQPVVISARTRTLLPVIRMSGQVLIVVVGSLMALATWGVQIGPLLAGLSIFGLAISFGSQTLVKDFVTGLFILLENDIDIGDTVTVGDATGVVENTGIRTLKLRDVNGALHIIPYSTVSGVVNLSRDYTVSILELTVGHHADLDQMGALVREVSEEMQQDERYRDVVLAPASVLGVKTISDVGLVLLALLRTRPDPYRLASLEFTRRLKQKYDTHKIQIPFPKRDVFMHSV